MDTAIQLKGITWDHSRGFTSVVATGQRFHELNPHIDIHWQKRSLQEFADKPLAALAEDYDLLVIDHPWAGFASTSGILADLNALLPADFLVDQAANSVGHSHASYQFNGGQWALAIDAATPVSAYRADILEKAGVTLPGTYDELITLAEKGLVCCPSIPLDVYGNFLNLLTAAGETIFSNEEEIVQREAGVVALERLRKFTNLIPKKFFDINPIGALEIMSQSDEFAYCPYTYGYTNYSRPGYARHLLKFGDVVGMTADKPGMTMLGGTGLAISARCKHLDVASAYAQFTASSDVQQGIFFDAGGQPGHRAAWLNPKLNTACSDFFVDTLPTLDRAFVRPRYAGYLDFQDHAGDPIHAYLREGGDAGAVLDALNKLYRETRK
ncbi:ABC transporter substrate-binding protein [Rubellicoccus peritrichatus]|uniref:Extracellular solute-binding protein n=1 Tax=Rubellicoccus peritrichatus TaxID=3080537 RepID=A0AAQ3LF02_9BACT|nr:extracellular solute-binding protein [Puniceicoccus sp. CR14]WOO42700.1 extracellular solute-binding protein [Puniceicoccus sp. CR14]